jgi:8-oxo-dGTP diphosphatase
MNNSPRYREIACAIIIDRRGRFLFQQRDDIAGILYPGMVGLFGGHREGSETFLECVVREVHEELSYFISADDFQYLTSILDEDTGTNSGDPVRGEIFVVRNVPVEAVVVTEGLLLIVQPEEAVALGQRLTPTARLALEAFRTADLI